MPFNAQFQRSYLTDGLAGEDLAVIESEFVLDAQNRIARFRVMGNRTELEEEIASFERRLFTYLSLFGLGMIAINAVAILLGLRPLSRVRNALAMVREGAAQRLDGRFPAEIEPLANETNALIENNRRIVERSRTQVGNLAHSLKTPLAVLINEGRALGGAKGTLITEQAAAMREQVDHYLKRARVAAQRDSVVYRTPVTPLLERLVRVLEKLGRMNVSLTPPCQRDRVCRRARGSRGDRRQSARERHEMGEKPCRRLRAGIAARLARRSGDSLLSSRTTAPAFPRTRRARR